MKHKLILIFLASLVLLSSCKEKHSELKDNEYKITASFENTNGNYIKIFKVFPKEKVFVDSIKIDENGEFTYTSTLNETSIFLFYENEENTFRTIISPTEEIIIKGDLLNMSKSVEITGGEDAEILSVYENYTRINQQKAEELSLYYNENPYIPDSELDSLNIVFEEILSNQKSQTYNFITENINSLASVIAIYEGFRREIVFDPIKDFELFAKLDSNLMTSYQNNSHVEYFHQQIVKNRPKYDVLVKGDELISIGSNAPDFILYNQFNQPLQLSNFKGYNVLLYFWSSKDIGMNEITRHIKNLHWQYYGRAFTIIAISIDENAEDWITTINNNYLAFNNVRANNYWDSKVINDYYIEKLPYTILIDKKGNIFDKDIYLNDLDASLARLMQ